MTTQTTATETDRGVQETMQAVVCRRYGAPLEALEVDRVPVPSITHEEVLVRVRAASVNPYDWHVVTGRPYLMRGTFGLRAPKVGAVGADFAGTVEAVGGGVTDVTPGDAVFGEVEAGAFAEHVAVPATQLAPKPRNLTLEEAAAVPMVGLTALQGLRDVGRLQAGQQVLINGASGGVGTAAVQIAAALGAEVTGVCSTHNVELVRSLGAAHVIDYTRADRSRADFTLGDVRYDLILDLIGNHPPWACRRALTRHGTYVASFGRAENRVLGPMLQLGAMFALSPLVPQRLTTFVAKPRAEDLRTLAAMIDAGDLRPVIDRTYPLADAPKALGYLAHGHARGKVVITI